MQRQRHVLAADQDVRTAVHRPAAELVAQRGADQVAIPAVAERAGVNPSTIYRCWGTLPALPADMAAQRTAPSLNPPVTCARTWRTLRRGRWWTNSRPWGVAFFRVEVARDVGERRAGPRPDVSECKITRHGRGGGNLRCCQATLACPQA
ncbi:hypothetical protein GCM10023191_058780 [Actinoallomurus oryzae]|uniref:HTH tetR-type domain-containing protein n=1 Tax=Actinoallomurus oryzae TaxID=502180 RepID=A0ABP8QLW9_9ACTN